jgi:hypothetical protein
VQHVDRARPRGTADADGWLEGLLAGLEGELLDELQSFPKIAIIGCVAQAGWTASGQMR